MRLSQRHWEREGFVEMVPPVRLPTTHDHRDELEVWLRFPPAGLVEVTWLQDQARPTLRSPPGTRADRVESLRNRGEGGWSQTVMDVRGWVIGERGPLRGHVLRPRSGEPRAELVGWSWPLGDAAARRAATERLAVLVGRTQRPVRRPPLDDDGVARFVDRNECGSCHAPNQAITPFEDAPMPRRATDANGCYTLVMMLATEVPLSEARPVDLNARDPYVRIRCGDRTVDFPTSERDPECASERAPVAFRDVRAGLADGDEYTQRVCRGRRYIHAHMSPAAREAFARAFGECDIGSPRP